MCRNFWLPTDQADSTPKRSKHFIPWKACYHCKENPIPSADERFFLLSSKLEMADRNRSFLLFCESCPHCDCKNGDPSWNFHASPHSCRDRKGADQSGGWQSADLRDTHPTPIDFRFSRSLDWSPLHWTRDDEGEWFSILESAEQPPSREVSRSARKSQIHSKPTQQSREHSPRGNWSLDADRPSCG